MKNTNTNQTPRKGTPRSNQTYYEKYKNGKKVKNKQVPAAASKENGPAPAYPPYCGMGMGNCACPKKHGKNVENPEKDVAAIHVVETEKVSSPPVKFRTARLQNPCEALKKSNACKPVATDVMKKKDINASYLSRDSSKQTDRRGSKGDEEMPASLAPPLFAPVLKQNKRNERKGSILEERTKSMPLYKTLLSRLNISRWKIYKYGEKGSGFEPKTDQSLDFYTLRDECLQNGTLFEDREFPATNSSLFFKKTEKCYEWKRPREIVDSPQFFVDDFSRFDIKQGALGNCWFLAAVANLTLNRRLFLQIVPDDQDFDDNYAGIFHFRFWQYGRWIDIFVDDRLPTYKGELVYLRSSAKNEFWSALLEKAYAKIHICYEALKGGSTGEAMEDLTGGVTEMYQIDISPPNLFQILLKAYERSSLMGPAIEPDPTVQDAQTPEGLVKGHAYSITRVQYADIQTPNVSGKIPLLRLRNPWGDDFEWNGPWSDGAPEWRFISDNEKEELGLTFDYDGEFWMSFKDFHKYFDRLEICNLNPDSLSEEELIAGNKKRWDMSVYEGEWVRGVTAGGCRNYLSSFWHNPQYRVTLTEVDDDDDECTMIVALMQKKQNKPGASSLSIGFSIYYLPRPDRLPKPLDIKFFKYNASAARSPSFLNMRSVNCRFKLPPGTYCIIPSTFDPNQDGQFLLRVFTEQQNIMEENDQLIGYEDKSTKDAKELTPEETEETDKVQDAFLQKTGGNLELDWPELKEILDSTLGEELNLARFSKDICRSMVAMLDTDRSGKLNFKEFQKLWTSLRSWRNAWALHDVDKSGTFSGFELREALNAAGYKLNNRILNILMHRYGNKQGEITFDDFIMCAVKLKTMIDLYKEKEDSETNTACFTIEEWLESTLYS